MIGTGQETLPLPFCLYGMLLVEQDIILVARIFIEANLGEMIPSKMDVAPHPLTMFKLILNEGPILDINALRSIKSWHQIYGN